MSDVAELERWLSAGEDEHVEFKAATQSFPFDKSIDYCVAIANEGGGKLILGVTDDRPRRVVGSNVVIDAMRLYDKLKLRVRIEEIAHPDGRVVVLHIPGRPAGVPLHNDGRYLMRVGESLVPMSPDEMKSIFDELQADFSAEPASTATLHDLSADAIERFRAAWLRKSGNQSLEQFETEHLLSDAGLLANGRVTNAALILLGTPKSVGRFLPHAETVFEWRDSETRIDFQDRREFRTGLFLFLDELWSLVNLRNTRQSFREGLFARDIPTFNEDAVREAILNAVAHRDYRSQTSVFVRQSPATIEIESPGGFPPGVTLENILFRQVPRNRRLSETLAKVGLVERSGQGIDRMFATSIREGKEPPDFKGSDAHRVSVVLRGTVQDPNFLRFLEKVGDSGTYVFATADLVLLDLLRNEKAIPAAFRARLKPLSEHGVIEQIGRGRGTKYILSKKFYDFVGAPAVYTRSRGLDRQTNKELLAQHLRARGEKGSSFAELSEVLPTLSRPQVKSLLAELKANGRARVEGVTRGAVWFASEEEMELEKAKKSQKRSN
jgi:ATP-dependent DNA helicase RecG